MEIFNTIKWWKFTSFIQDGWWYYLCNYFNNFKIDKIVNDYTYLYVSELSKIYELSESSDPFFLRILNKESEQQKY